MSSPSRKVLERWREHARDPYDYWRPRWVTPEESQWYEHWKGVFEIALRAGSFPQKEGTGE